VNVERQGANLHYTVRDDGVGVDDTRIKSGTGLSNVARRLELLFPEAHTFNLAAGQPTGAVVTLSFPAA
jgi:LytS/YehU family sensor histidine kinase